MNLGQLGHGLLSFHNIGSDSESGCIRCIMINEVLEVSSIIYIGSSDSLRLCVQMLVGEGEYVGGSTVCRQFVVCYSVWCESFRHGNLDLISGLTSIHLWLYYNALLISFFLSLNIQSGIPFTGQMNERYHPEGLNK